MNVDITNHLIPWTVVKRMLKDAWDEGRTEGFAQGADYPDHDASANPYQEVIDD